MDPTASRRSIATPPVSVLCAPGAADLTRRDSRSGWQLRRRRPAWRVGAPRSAGSRRRAAGARCRAASSHTSSRRRARVAMTSRAPSDRFPTAPAHGRAAAAATRRAGPRGRAPAPRTPGSGMPSRIRALGSIASASMSTRRTGLPRAPGARTARLIARATSRRRRHGRHEERDHGVDAVVGAARPRAPCGSRRGRPSRACRSGCDARFGREAAPSRMRVCGERGELEVRARGGVGAEDAESAGIGHDRDAVPAGNGSPARSDAASSNSSSVRDAQDARLFEERVDSGLGSRERGGVRRGCSRTGLAGPALHREDRLERATRLATRAKRRGLPNDST